MKIEFLDVKSELLIETWHEATHVPTFGDTIVLPPFNDKDDHQWGVENVHWESALSVSVWVSWNEK